MCLFWPGPCHVVVSVPEVPAVLGEVLGKLVRVHAYEFSDFMGPVGGNAVQGLAVSHLSLVGFAACGKVIASLAMRLG